MKFTNYLTAGFKVLYDKSVDYARFYSNWDDKEDARRPVDNDLAEDNLADYPGIINPTDYANEKENKRILKKMGIWSECSTVLSPPTHVVGNIYLGSAYNAASFYKLKEMDIKVIFNVTKEIRNYYPDDFTYINYTIYDNNQHSIYEFLEEAYQKIKHYEEHTNGSILIHCFMGASRSASVVIYYLMKTMKHPNGKPFSFDDALQFLQKKRPIVNPTFRLTKDLAKSILID